jgi:hypothetical protein
MAFLASTLSSLSPPPMAIVLIVSTTAKIKASAKTSARLSIKMKKKRTHA